MKRQLMMRTTIRARLTLVYGGLFLLAGMVLLGVTYVLVGQRMPRVDRGGPERQAAGCPPRPSCPRSARRAEHRGAADIRAEGAGRRAASSALDSLLTQGGIALAVVSAAAIAFGWLIAGRALQPLHQITDTARRIADATAPGAGCTSGSRCAGRRTRCGSWPTPST